MIKYLISARTCILLLASGLLSSISYADLQPGEAVGIDFGTGSFAPNYNQYTTVNSTIANLVSLADGTTLTGVAVSTSNAGAIGPSPTAGAVPGIFHPDAALHWIVRGGGNDFQITFSNLSSNSVYDLHGLIGDYPVDSIQIVDNITLTAGSQTLSFGDSQSGPNSVYFDDISPNASGEIVINVSNQDNAGGYRALSALILTSGSGYDAGTGGGGDDGGSTATIPQVPVILRDVATIKEESGFHKPHIPPHRISSDGRIALKMKPGFGTENFSSHFFLHRPESLTTHFNDSNPGMNLLTDPYTIHDSVMLPDDPDIILHHRTIVDLTNAFPTADRTSNPYTLGDGFDYYDLAFIGVNATRLFTDNADAIGLVRRDIRIKVGNPKTASAYIESITFLGEPEFGPLTHVNILFEPLVTEDGKLFVSRISDGSTHQWTDPDTGQPRSGRAEIVYAYSDTPMDLAAWTNLIPITHAPYDSRINTKYGFAMHPFRDTEGNVIADGIDLEGTYPWIDKQGKNLFFTAVSTQLNTGAASRYPNTNLSGVADNKVIPGSVHLNGTSVVGLWTQGKIVLLDNSLNNIDFWDAQSRNDTQRRVQLFEDDTGINSNESGWVRVGGGAENTEWTEPGFVGHPAKSAANTIMIDSLEHLFNFSPKMKTVTPSDVVWRISSGGSTEEFAFDDYLYLDSFIVSRMTGAITHTPWKYHDGWGGTSFNQTVKIANAGTATTNRWAIPAHGIAFSSGTPVRLEPVALGGVAGKGLWLNQQAGIRYPIAAQPQSVAASDWFFSLFIDPRHGGAEGEENSTQKLLHFPDDSQIRLKGLTSLEYVKAGQVVHTITFPAPLSEKAWTHLGFQITPGASQIEFYLNGMLFDRLTGNTTSLFQLTPGNLYLGAKENVADEPGFFGWVDDFKVFGQKFNPEEIANHAKATLVGLSGAYQGKWNTIASTYPAVSHQEITTLLTSHGRTSFPKYVAYHDYTGDDIAHLGSIPTGAVSVRESILMPEFGFAHDVPRPDFTNNSFCFSCHDTGLKGGLGVEALTPLTGVSWVDDTRRQPSQPFRIVTGHIPQDWLHNEVSNQASRFGESGTHAEMKLATDEYVLIEEWILSSQSQTQSEDRDGDGITDSWEEQSFGGLLTQNAATDRDQDGTLDIHEYYLNLNPNNPSDYFSSRLTIDSGSVNLSWPSSMGVSYRVHSSSDLRNWSFVDIVDDVGDDTYSMEEPIGGNDRMFYRIEIIGKD